MKKTLFVTPQEAVILGFLVAAKKQIGKKQRKKLISRLSKRLRKKLPKLEFK